MCRRCTEGCDGDNECLFSYLGPIWVWVVTRWQPSAGMWTATQKKILSILEFAKLFCYALPWSWYPRSYPQINLSPTLLFLSPTCHLRSGARAGSEGQDSGVQTRNTEKKKKVSWISFLTFSRYSSKVRGSQGRDKKLDRGSIGSSRKYCIGPPPVGPVPKWSYIG